MSETQRSRLKRPPNPMHETVREAIELEAGDRYMNMRYR